MLVSQFQEVRRFMGRLDEGQDLVAAFATICRDSKVRSGWIQAWALIRSPVIEPPGEDGGLEAECVFPGLFMFSSLSGNVSLLDDLTHVRLVGAGFSSGEQEQSRVFGLLRGGEVVCCEFVLTAFDDVALIRDMDSPFQDWVQLQTTSEAKTRPVMNVPIEGAMARPSPVPQTQMDEEEMSELNILDMEVGNYVDHPRFGVCKIVHAPVDDRVSIRLPTGKNADLHLGVMIVHSGKVIDGRKIFKVEMRKRV